jgi:hypothetical protein
MHGHMNVKFSYCYQYIFNARDVYIKTQVKLYI